MSRMNRSFRPARIPSGMPIASDSDDGGEGQAPACRRSPPTGRARRTTTKPVAPSSASRQPPTTQADARPRRRPGRARRARAGPPMKTLDEPADDASRIGVMTTGSGCRRLSLDPVARSVVERTGRAARIVVVGQRPLAAEGEVQDDGRDAAEQRRPCGPRDARDRGGRPRRRDGGHRRQLASRRPRSTVRISARSTTPSELPVVDDPDRLVGRGRGVDGRPDDRGRRERRARRARRPGVGVAHDPAQRQDVRLRHVPDEVARRSRRPARRRAPRAARPGRSRPSRMITMWSPSLSASARSWVMKIIVLPTSWWSRMTSFCMSRRISGSRALNGSSKSITSGSTASARASPTRCCCRPRAGPGSCWRGPRGRRARASRAARGMPLGLAARRGSPGRTRRCR